MFRLFANFSKSSPRSELSKAQSLDELQKAHQQRLFNAGLIPPDLATEQFKKRLQTAKVFYDTQLFPPNRLQGDGPFSLERSLKMVAAVDMQASEVGETQSGEPWPGADFFMNLNPGDSRGLSPEERSHARRKIIASQAMIFRFGGYPSNNPVVELKKPQSAFIFTMPGLQFEDPRLDYKNYFLDPYSNKADYAEVHDLLKAKKITAGKKFTFLKHGFFTYLVRNPDSGSFAASLFPTNGIIFNKEKYFHTLVNDFVMLFAAVESMEDKNKKTYLKLPFMGLGYFANLDKNYSIKNHLIYTYLDALTFVLNTYSFANLECIEIPIFDEDTGTLVNLYTSNKPLNINHTQIYFAERVDVLNFNHVDPKKYNFCVINPGDANSFPGNEIGFDKNTPVSVESAIGNNTDIRVIQNSLLNREQLLDFKNWIGINIFPKTYKIQIEPPELQEQSMVFR